MVLNYTKDVTHLRHTIKKNLCSLVINIEQQRNMFFLLSTDIIKLNLTRSQRMPKVL